MSKAFKRKHLSDRNERILCIHLLQTCEHQPEHSDIQDREMQENRVC